MAAKAAADQEAPPPAGETLKCQTWVLRVLIHCDGCKKKVKKVLQGIDGVYTTEVDSQQHKVRVTGNVEAETLIKRLERTGKFAELLPEIKPPPPPEKKKEKKKSGNNNNNNNKEKVQDQLVGNDGGSNNEGCIDFPEEDSDKDNNGDECKDVGFVGGGGGDDNGGVGENGKKKKKKKNNKNKSGGNGSDFAPPPPNNNSVGGGEETSNNNKIDAGQEQQPPSSIATNNSFLASKDNLIGPPIQHAYPSYPQMYYSPNSLPFPLPHHQHAYGLSYNTAYPVSSSSYYVASPIMPMHAYNAPYPRLPPPPPPPSHPIKRYDHDDDDEYYGSGCSIM